VSDQRSTPHIGDIPVLFLKESEETVAVEPQYSDVEEQAGIRWPWKVKVTEAVIEQLNGDTLKKSLDTIIGQLQQVLEGPSEASSGGFALDEFRVGLQIEGKGTIALVAEIGGHASIELTFKRR
jgi:hypothetical protein